MKLFQDLWEEQVQQSPNAIALECNDVQLTYEQLNDQVNQLAHYLQSLGVKSEIRVGICAERSLELIIGILGIWKAGGAYVPLDPKYPKERSEFILQETKISWLLTQEHLREEFPSYLGKIINLDTDCSLLRSYPQDDPLRTVQPDNLAYIIYTSGSTGKPKGVQITQENVSYYLKGLTDLFPITEQDYYLHTASFSFSSSLRQLLFPLCKGAKVIVATDEYIKNPLQLFQFIIDKKVTVFDTVASVWRYGIQSLDTLPLEKQNLLHSSQLRFLVFSGGLLPCPLLKKVRRQFPINKQPQVFNLYGQTETLGVCANCVPEDFERDSGYVPVVGKLYDHNCIHVVDENLNLLPMGEIGELAISGKNLARGYLNRPQDNETKFISNPFSEDPFNRLFRSGDVARILESGGLEILGRVDFQVKIRGMRVETGEIEAVLENHPQIKQSVVSAHETLQGETQLVAYLIPKSGLTMAGHSSLKEELRHEIQGKLPDYMIPAHFMFLDALPLTPNGKLDRRALPEPSRDNLELTQQFIPPSNEIEGQLVEIWEKWLEQKPIGICDHFFEIGGHSLLAAQIFSEIEQTLGVKLPLALLMKVPTIKEIAEILQSDRFTDAWSSLVPIQPNGDNPPFFVSHGIGGNVLNYSNLALELGLHQPLYGLQAQGLDGKTQPLTTIEAIAARNIQTMQAFQAQGPYLIGGYSFGGLVAFEMAQQLRQQGQEIALLVILDSHSPYALERIHTTPLSPYERLARHWRRFSQQGFEYLVERWQDRMKGMASSSKAFDQLPSEDWLPKDDGTNIVIQTSHFIRKVNRAAKSRYTPTIYDGKITLFRSRLGRPIPEGWKLDPLLVWRKMTSVGVEVYDVPGNHGSFMDYPNVLELAQKLNQCLQNARSDLN